MAQPLNCVWASSSAARTGCKDKLGLEPCAEHLWFGKVCLHSQNNMTFGAMFRQAGCACSSQALLSSLKGLFCPVARLIPEAISLHRSALPGCHEGGRHRSAPQVDTLALVHTLSKAARCERA